MGTAISIFAVIGAIILLGVFVFGMLYPGLVTVGPTDPSAQRQNPLGELLKRKDQLLQHKYFKYGLIGGGAVLGLVVLAIVITMVWDAFDTAPIPPDTPITPDGPRAAVGLFDQPLWALVLMLFGAGGILFALYWAWKTSSEKDEKGRRKDALARRALALAALAVGLGIALAAYTGIDWENLQLPVFSTADGELIPAPTAFDAVAMWLWEKKLQLLGLAVVITFLVGSWSHLKNGGGGKARLLTTIVVALAFIGILFYMILGEGGMKTLQGKVSEMAIEAVEGIGSEDSAPVPAVPAPRPAPVPEREITPAPERHGYVPTPRARTLSGYQGSLTAGATLSGMIKEGTSVSLILAHPGLCIYSPVWDSFTAVSDAGKNRWALTPKEGDQILELKVVPLGTQIGDWVC